MQCQFCMVLFKKNHLICNNLSLIKKKKKHQIFVTVKSDRIAFFRSSNHSFLLMFFDACKITSWSVILTACNIRIIFLISFFHYIWHLKSFAECLKIFSFYLWLTQILHKLTTSFDTNCSTYKNSSGRDKKITGVSICDNLMDTSNTGWWQSQLNCMHTYYKYRCQQ